MLSILSIFAIFVFIITLFLASLKIIDLVFVTKNRFKGYFFKRFFTGISLLFWFSLSAFTTVFISNWFFKLPQIWFSSTQKAIADVAIAQEDCQQLKETIYDAENKIYKLENHRYIEEVAPIFTIKLEYEKGANTLNSVAEDYLKLDISENSQHYSQQIAQKLQDKAQLFQERTKIVENSKGIRKIADLLKKMDRATEQRKSLIKVVKKQCNS